MSFIESFPLIIILILFITAFIMPLIKKTKIVKGISLVSMTLVNDFSINKFKFCY